MRQHKCDENAIFTISAIIVGWGWPEGREDLALLTVYDGEGRREIVAVFEIAYCPFCGQKLVEEG